MGEPEKAKGVFRRAIARGALPTPTAPQPGADPFERARHRLKELVGYYRAAGELDNFESGLRQRIRKNPDDPAGYYELAALLQNIGHRGRALSTVEKLQARRPKDPEVLEVLARLYKERGDYRTAADLFERSLKLGAFHKRALYRDLIACYRRIGEERKAFELERQMAWEMGDEFALYRLALQLQKDGRMNEAGKAYRRYLTLKYARYTHLSGRRRNLRVALELAKFLLSSNQAREALLELEGYLSLVRGLPVSSFERRNFIQQLTDLYRRAGILGEKLAEWDRKSARDPFFLDLLYHYHESQGHAEEKLRLLERTVALRPRDERRIEALAEEYTRRARYDDAIRTLKRLEGFATSPNYLMRIGSLYHYKGQREEALAHWRRYVEARFSYPQFRDFRSRRLFALAEILDREGYRELAEHSRIQAVEAAASVDAYQYGRIIGEYVRRGRYEAAITITLKAMEKVTDLQQRRNLFYALLPYGYYALRHLKGLRRAAETQGVFAGAEREGHPRADMAHLFFDILGERYRSAGNEAQASEAFELALRYKDDADTLRNLVGIYKRLGREVEIARLYERLLVRRPDASAYLRAAADVYLALKQPDKALPLLERDARTNPSVGAYLKLVDVYAKQGTLAKAEPYLLEARKVAPHSLDIAEKLEEMYRALPDPAKLQAFYAGLTYSEKIAAGDVPRLAALLERGGKTYAAVEVYKLGYLRSPPGSWLRRQAQDKLTRALSRLGHSDLADEDLLQELPQAHSRAQMHERLAELLGRHQMPGKALAQIKRAAFLAPQRAELWLGAARMAEGLGLAAEARGLVAWGSAVAAGADALRAAAERLAARPPAAPATAVLRRVLWRAPVAGDCAIAPEVRGELAVGADCGRAQIVAFGLRDGLRRWSFSLPPLPAKVERGGVSFEWSYRFAGLTIAGDRVVAVANEDQFESAPGLGTGRVRRVHLFALRLKDGAKLWHRAEDGNYAGGPAAGHGTIVLHGQNLRAFSLDRGQPLWSAYAGSNAYGWIFDERNGTRPALRGDSVYAAGLDGRLYAFDLGSGQPRWTFRAGAAIHASPLATGDAVFLLAADGYFYAVDALAGRLRWKFRAASDARTEDRRYAQGKYTRARRGGRPAVDGKNVYFATAAGVVYALRRANGAPKWTRKLADRSGRDLALEGGRLFVTGRRHALYALRAETGEIEWQYARPASSAPAVGSGVLVALVGDGEATEDRRLTAFDFSSSALLRGRAEALAALAEKLERGGDRALLEALLRDASSPVDSDFRRLHLKLMQLAAQAGDVSGVLKRATRLLALGDGDATWFPELRTNIERAMAVQARRPRAAGALRLPTAVPAAGFPRALRAHLDALPLDERAQLVPAELMLLREARTRAEILAALSRLRALQSPLQTPAAPFLFALAQDGDPEVRMRAALALAEAGDYSAKRALREALGSHDAGLRRAAIQALAASHEPGDLTFLRFRLSDVDPAVRREAALLVAERELDPAALSGLQSAVRGGDDELAIRAAIALGKHGDRSGVPKLRQLAAQRRGPVQIRAANALYDLGDPSGLPTLLAHRRREAGARFLSTVRLVVGNIHLLLEDDRSALLEYRSILSFDPEFDKAHANIGRLYHLRRRDAEAIAALAEALRRNPFLTSALVYRGLSRARLGDTAGGLSDVREALAKDPRAKLAHTALAEVLARRGELEAAQRALEDVLKKWPLHAPSWHHAARLRLGEAGRAFANLALAEEHARKAVSLAPENATYHRALAEVYLAQGRHAEAASSAQEAVRTAVGEAQRERMRAFAAKLRAQRQQRERSL
jgi:tetratricopeptide (TPR) repeat protein